MKYRRFISSLFVITSLISGLFAQNINVSSGFDTSRIYIGDQIIYTVTVDQPSDITLNIETPEDTLFKNIEILSGPITDTLALDNNRLRIIKKYLVTSFDSGFYEVPPTFAELTTETGIKRYYSDYSPLEVMRVNIAPSDSTAQIFDIIEPYNAPLTFGEIGPWILLVFLTVALIWSIMRLMKRFRKTLPEYKPVIVKEPAHVIAFRDLEKLKEQKLWQKGEVKHYYSRLTEIIRQYLENRYGVYSLELTTSETLEELLRTGFKKDDIFMKLKDILNGSDLVKFAKYKPDPSENELHFENSWQFVDVTKLQEASNEKVSEDGLKEKTE